MGDQHHARRLRGDEHDAVQAVTGAGEERHEEHQRHHAQVLENEDSHGHLAVGRIHLPCIHEQFHENCGAGKGDQETEENRLGQGEAESDTRQGGHQDGAAHLQPASHEHQVLDAHQLLQGELYADGEQKQDHTDLRHLLHLMGVLDQGECVGACQDAGYEKADDGREHEAPEQDDGCNGQPEENLHVLQYRVIHKNSISRE